MWIVKRKKKKGKIWQIHLMLWLDNKLNRHLNVTQNKIKTEKKKTKKETKKKQTTKQQSQNKQNQNPKQKSEKKEWLLNCPFKCKKVP